MVVATPQQVISSIQVVARSLKLWVKGQVKYQVYKVHIKWFKSIVHIKWFKSSFISKVQVKIQIERFIIKAHSKKVQDGKVYAKVHNEKVHVDFMFKVQGKGSIVREYVEFSVKVHVISSGRGSY